MFIRQISKIRALPQSLPSYLTEKLISKAEHLSNRIVFLASTNAAVHPNKINLVHFRSFHSQIGLTLNYREKYDEDEGGYTPDGYSGSREKQGRNDRYGGGFRDNRNRYGDGARHKQWYEDDVPDHRQGRDRFESSDFGNKLTKKDWNASPLTVIQKKLYQPTESVENRSDEEIAAFRASGQISIIRGESLIPKPISTFQEAGFPKEILSALEKTDFDAPMPIQAQGWPIAMSGLDLVGIGQTGSGKTLGFVLPAIVHIKAQDRLMRGDGPIALVIAPTRELAQQIQKVVDIFGRPSNIRSVCLFGGASRNMQIKDLGRGAEMVIATPGRLIDLLEAGITNLDRCSYVVLDEADRCLDMGFEPQLRKILGQVRPDRQMLMWSATWPQEVRSLARDFFTTEKNDGEGYVHLNIGSHELQANHNICQKIEVVLQGQKVSRLLELLRTIRNEANEAEEDTKNPGRILIFSDTKRTVDFLERLIEREGHRVGGIHGDKSQMQRDRALQDFRSGRTPVLVATDVASRGIDVDDVKCVINFDYPKQVEDYIHRIGRTGRRGRLGTAYTFITDENAKQVKDLMKVLKEAKQEIPVELLELHDSNASFSNSRGRSSSFSRSGSENRYNKSYTFQDRQRRHSSNWDD